MTVVSGLRFADKFLLGGSLSRSLSLDQDPGSGLGREDSL